MGLIDLITFILGACVGSFLNCLIYRLEKKEKFLGGRSFCPRCKHKLKAWDLVPLLSFIFLRGRCRYCKGKISWQYPLVELAAAGLFLLIFNEFSIFNFQSLLSIAYYFILSAFLLIIFVYDFKHYLIPDEVIYPAIGITFLWRILESLEFVSNFQFSILNFQPLISAFSSACLASGAFFLIWFISRGKWLGFGDIKLAFLLGLFLGFPNILVALFSTFLIGAIIGIGLVILGKKKLQSQVPFGPFLVTGTFIALFWGEKIVKWYLGII